MIVTHSHDTLIVLSGPSTKSTITDRTVVLPLLIVTTNYCLDMCLCVGFQDQICYHTLFILFASYT